uniref:helix-turn-helix domain-containing protein n=1 Tax=Granulicella tundricola TaxID=940615 RepID=UPI001E47861B|nr:helix-turn-helix domain-containing protein [Granulicella tundricola]
MRAGRRTVAAAAAVLAISERQAYRSLARYEVGGDSGLIHKARGRTSNRSRNEGIRRYAVELVKTRHADFGPRLATKMLLDKHELRVGRETLRR